MCTCLYDVYIINWLNSHRLKNDELNRFIFKVLIKIHVNKHKCKCYSNYSLCCIVTITCKSSHTPLDMVILHAASQFTLWFHLRAKTTTQRFLCKLLPFATM